MFEGSAVLDEPEEEEVSGISRQRLDPDEARTHFSSDGAEGKPGGQQGRISSKRKSYKQNNRRTKADDVEVLETGDLSEDEEEGFESKLARLRREIAEVKVESERRKAHNQTVSKKELELDADDLDSLSNVLEDVQSSSHRGSTGAASRLIQRINSTSENKVIPSNRSITNAPHQPQSYPTYTLNYAPTYPKDHTLAKVADFDARLTLLEMILGAGTIPLATQDKADTKPILPAMESLQQQISVVSNASDSSLESSSRRIKQLTKDAEKLTEARKAAKAAQDALSMGESGIHKGGAVPQDIEDPERLSKINALYGTLPTIESLSPLLPPLLDRLRSLRSVHANAANASQSLAQAESRQEAMAEELKSWREGLEKAERMLKESEQTMGSNMSTVEGWVEELEERMQKLTR